MFEGTFSPPFYTDLYNFRDGAQNDIFQDSYVSIPVPGPNQTELPVLAADVSRASPAATTITLSSVSPSPSVSATPSSEVTPNARVGSWLVVPCLSRRAFHKSFTVFVVRYCRLLNAARIPGGTLVQHLVPFIWQGAGDGWRLRSVAACGMYSDYWVY